MSSPNPSTGRNTHETSTNRDGNQSTGRGKSNNETTNTSFVGREPTMKHDIFDYQPNKQAQKYQDNLEALKIYIGRQYNKYTAELIQ